MALNFPDAPTTNQIFTAVGLSWRWDSVKWVVSGAGPTTVLVCNITTTLPVGFSGIVRVENTTSAPITITLPSSPSSGQEITIKDSTGNASLYPITISGGGVNIENTATLVLNFNYSWVGLYYTGSKWVQI